MIRLPENLSEQPHPRADRPFLPMQPEQAGGRGAPEGEPSPFSRAAPCCFTLPTNRRNFLTASRSYWRKEAIQWLFWQMGGLGPMAGQNHHFGTYAPEKLPYAINRYVNETARLYAVMDNVLPIANSRRPVFDCRHGLLPVGGAA